MRAWRTSTPIVTATGTDTGMVAITGRIPIAPTGTKRKIRRYSKMPRFGNTVIVAVLLVAPFAGNAQTEPDGQAMASTQRSAPALVIGSGDLVSVSIFDDPELSGRFRVDHKGDVEMPL